MAANERWAIFAERLQEVVRELERQSEFFPGRADIQLGILESILVTIAKAQAAIRKLTPGGQGGTAEITSDIR